MQSQTKAIDHLVRRIIDEVHPLRIFVFGSAAKGVIGADSDID